MERVCFLTNYNQYESKRHFALELARAMEGLGIETKTFDSEDMLFRKMPKFWIEEFSPDLTLSFNSFIRDADGLFPFEKFEVPNLSILVDPALYYTDMAASPYSMLSVVDLSDIEVIKGFGNDKVFFLPHGAPKELGYESEEKKEFDAVFIGSCYDYNSLQRKFREILTPPQVSILENAAEIF